MEIELAPELASELIPCTTTTTTNEETDHRLDRDMVVTVSSISPCWAFIRRCCVNCVLPFLNGVMLGFGEIVAHEWCFRRGWGGARVQPVWRMFPTSSSSSSSISPGTTNSVLTR